MAPISPRGSITSPVWVVIETPYEQDISKGFCFSSGYGYVFDKMMRDAGLTDYYVVARRSDFDHPDTYSVIESAANSYKPPIIIPLGNSLGFFCPETRKKATKGKTKEEQNADLEKYSGSLLSSNLLHYPHYICPTIPPDLVVRDWSLRDIATNLDLGKAKSELDYFRAHGHLEPLPQRNLVYDFDEPGGFARLLDWIKRYESSSLLSVDIETIYPNKKSIHWPHPGLPVTFGMADSSREGISFRVFRESKEESLILWRALAALFSNSKIKILGQNFFDFDKPRICNLGFSIEYSRIVDTLIRHHILWPELPHKLQFQTRQYTRQPYYKDEGHGWHIKDLKKLMHYNCLDVCVTFEIYTTQEDEFKERPYLR
jgi:hypothetical protein